MSRMRIAPIEGARDLGMIREWLLADTYHRDVPVDMMNAPRTTGAIIADGAGPVLAFRLSHAIRLDTQLNPELWNTIRTKRALVYLGSQLRDNAIREGKIREIVTSAGSDQMRAFIRSFGYEGPIDDMSMWTVGTVR